MASKVVHLPSDKRIKARDDIARYLRHRLDLLTAQKIDQLINNLAKGESEPFEEIQWEWTVDIKGAELDTIKKLAKIMRGEEDERTG